jgi:hypothetical protein
MVDSAKNSVCGVSHVTVIIRQPTSPGEMLFEWILDATDPTKHANSYNLPNNIPNFSAYRDQDLEAIRTTAKSLEREVNDSLDIASTSTNLRKRKQILAQACAKIAQLQRMCLQHHFLTLAGLNEVQLQINQIQNETVALSCQPASGKGHQRRTREKRRKARDEVTSDGPWVDGPAEVSLKDLGLAFVSEKIESLEDEIQILKEALMKIPKTNRKHFDWIRTRIKELELRLRSSKPTT